jgi:hypothetical protein
VKRSIRRESSAICYSARLRSRRAWRPGIMSTYDQFMLRAAAVIADMALTLSTESDKTSDARLERYASDLRTKWSRAFPRMPIQTINVAVTDLVDRVRGARREMILGRPPIRLGLNG